MITDESMSIHFPASREAPPVDRPPEAESKADQIPDNGLYLDELKKVNRILDRFNRKDLYQFETGSSQDREFELMFDELAGPVGKIIEVGFNRPLASCQINFSRQISTTAEAGYLRYQFERIINDNSDTDQPKIIEALRSDRKNLECYLSGYESGAMLTVISGYQDLVNRLAEPEHWQGPDSRLAEVGQRFQAAGQSLEHKTRLEFQDIETAITDFLKTDPGPETEDQSQAAAKLARRLADLEKYQSASEAGSDDWLNFNQPTGSESGSDWRNFNQLTELVQKIQNQLGAILTDYLELVKSRFWVEVDKTASLVESVKIHLTGLEQVKQKLLEDLPEAAGQTPEINYLARQIQNRLEGQIEKARLEYISDINSLKHKIPGSESLR